MMLAVPAELILAYEVRSVCGEEWEEEERSSEEIDRSHRRSASADPARGVRSAPQTETFLGLCSTGINNVPPQ